MFRIIFAVITFFCVHAHGEGSIVNCAQLTAEEIIEYTKALPAKELQEMAERCADQRDMFMIVADEQTDAYERARYMRYALRASIASQQFSAAVEASLTRR